MEKETHWLRRAVSPLHHETARQNMLMGIWRVTGGTRLRNLDARSIIALNRRPSVHVLLVCTQLMGLPIAFKCNWPVWVLCLQRIIWCEQAEEEKELSLISWEAHVGKITWKE
eukprot:1139829-Pelagomonas_calceolata.AAC.1